MLVPALLRVLAREKGLMDVRGWSALFIKDRSRLQMFTPSKRIFSERNDMDWIYGELVSLPLTSGVSYYG